MENTTPTETQLPKKTHWLKYAVLAVFVLAALLTAYLTFISVRDFVASWNLTSLPGVPVVLDPTPTPQPGAQTTDVPIAQQPVPAAGPTPVPWDGASRVTLLVMGLDYRDWQAGEGPPRTDTMILLTLDPLNNTAGMLSIPRDLWVNIPGGFNNGRINTAYQLGEAYKLPGGGPALAAKTVEELLGVPIDYYAQVDFNAFVKFVDEIGGVKIDVPDKITIDPLGDNNIKNIKPGVQTMNGELALAYARARKTEGGDFDRAKRQQQVIMAIRNQILRPKMLPLLVSKAGVLYNELSSGIHTNLTLDQVIRLAWMATKIPQDQIKQGIIAPPDQVSLYKTQDGQEVLKPITEKIRLLRDEIFTASGPTSPLATAMPIADLLKQENARVRVLNGTYTAGLAATTSDYLKSQGINVTETGNASQVVANSEITFYTGKPYTIKFLVDLLKLGEFRLHHQNDPASPVDLTITLGNDWANSNPMQ